jgi:glycosyltransferase involved in cell wall biosynthesis
VSNARPTMLVISPWEPPACGIASHTYNLVAYWGETYDVHILSPGNKAEAENRDGVHVWRSLGGDYQQLIRNINPTWTYMAFSISSFGRQWNRARAALKTAAGFGPVGVGYHEPDREPRALPIVGRSIYRKMSETGIAVVYSQTAQKSYQALTGRQAVAVPHGCKRLAVDANKTAEILKRHGGKPFILSFGFVHPDKGQDVLIEAVDILSRAEQGGGSVKAPGEPTLCVIAGSVRKREGIFKINETRDRRYLNSLKEKARHSGANIEFVEYIPNDELSGYMQAAAVVVLPYRSGSQSGVAGTLISAGRGAVVSDLPGLVEQFKEAGAVCPVGDVAALAEKIAEVLCTGTERLDAAATDLREKQQ